MSKPHWTAVEPTIEAKMRTDDYKIAQQESVSLRAAAAAEQKRNEVHFESEYTKITIHKMQSDIYEL